MFIIGLFMTCIGVPLSVSTLRILYLLDTNSNARLTNGLTEDDIATMVIISVLLALVGIVLMIFGKARRKNEELSNSITNASKLDYCKRCHCNVESKDGICPICKNKIGE